jgi:DNA-binding FadR family transcriptional regulator
VAASREAPEPAVAAGTMDDLLFRPVRAGNAFEETVERLLQTIRLGVVGPGGRLPTEREMAARFEVSRVTVREAIGALKQAGYVESHRGRYGGTFVTRAFPRPSRRNAKQLAQEMGSALEDALTMRYVLEVGAAESAALRTLTDQDRDYLRQRLAEGTDVSLKDFRGAWPPQRAP